MCSVNPLAVRPGGGGTDKRPRMPRLRYRWPLPPWLMPRHCWEEPPSPVVLRGVPARRIPREASREP